jgi:hypothetical protein
MLPFDLKVALGQIGCRRNHGRALHFFFWGQHLLIPCFSNKSAPLSMALAYVLVRPLDEQYPPNIHTTLPLWLVEGARWRPTARLHLAAPAGRIACFALRCAFHLWGKGFGAALCLGDVLLADDPRTIPTWAPPCQWCGKGAASWCDGCESHRNVALCYICEEEFGVCRGCHNNR